MCTISETKVTTTIMSDVSRSIMKPTSKRASPTVSHVYTAELKLSPFSTSPKITHEARNESSTEKIAAVCAPCRVMRLPPSPAMRAPRSGANAATMTKSFIRAFSLSSLEAVQVFDVDGVQIAEQHHEDGEADGRFRRRHGEDE